MGGGLASFGHDGHSLVVCWVPADRGVDYGLGWLGRSLHQCEVALDHLSFLELPCEIVVGALVPCDDDEARRVLVEPVDQAWAGIILFILAYALFFVKPSNNTEKRWRGRPVDDDDDSERLRRWRGR